MSELVTTPLLSKLIQLRFSEVLQKRFQNANQLQLFQEATLGNTHAIREAINNGDAKFDDFLRVLEKAKKFKDWLKGVNQDFSLVEQYYSETTKATWIEKLPGKSARFAAFTGAGLAIDAIAPTGLGTLAGIGCGVVDAFYLDRFVKGWRPNQFIETTLKPFVDRHAE
jgi:hypothetical protein